MANSETERNQLRIGTLDKASKKYIGLGLEQVYIGTKKTVTYSTGQSETIIEPREIYNRKTQKRSCWFILDLETGRGRTDSWFPGCLLMGLTQQQTEIKVAPSDEAATVTQIAENTKLKILDRIHDIKNFEPASDEWYHIETIGTNNEGYVKATLVSALHYE